MSKLMIEASLQAIKEYASAVITDEKDVTNICGFCDDVYDELTNYVNNVVQQLEGNSVMRANSKAFYNNPQNGEYVDKVVILSKAIEIVKRGGENEQELH